MDDLTNMLSQVLNDPQSMQQIQAVASSLGLGGESTAPALPPAQGTPAENGGGFDLSALSSLLGGQEAADNTQPVQEANPLAGLDLSSLSSLLGGQGATDNRQPAQEANPLAGLDLSSLSSLLGGGNGAAAPVAPEATSTPDLSALLGGLMGGGQAPAAASQNGGVDLSKLSGLVQGITGKSGAQPAAGSPDLSALTALLGGGQASTGGGGGLGGLPFDLGTLLKLQKAMSSMAENRANVDLLLALKPRLKEKRAQKVDDAIRVMQLIQFLPLIKESGLFGDLGGGLGGIVGGLGDGINGVLGNLLGGSGRR